MCPERTRHWPRRAMLAISALVVAAGTAVWTVYALTIDPARAWRSMLICFLYFTPLAMGMAVWPATVVLARGQWTGQHLIRTSMTGLAFAPFSLLLFVLLFFGRQYWAQWIQLASPEQSWWLNQPLVFLRDGLGLLLAWVMVAVFVRQLAAGRPNRHFAGWLGLVYGVVLSVLGFDMVMSLQPRWFSALFGWYFMVTGTYIALAGWVLWSLVNPPGLTDRRKHDLGKLLVAMSLLSAYMMYSQLIVIWYENLPHEVLFVIPRLRQQPWRAISMALVASVYLGPLVFLLIARAKRSTYYLGASAAVILVMMWVERWWLVTPTLGGNAVYGGPEASMTLACLGALVLGATLMYSRLPAIPEERP